MNTLKYEASLRQEKIVHSLSSLYTYSKVSYSKKNNDMKTKHLFSILIIFTVLFFSCKTTKNVKSDNSNALLWKIEGEKLTQPSYLFGTIHLIDSANYFLPNGLENAIDASKEVVFEVDMRELEDDPFAMFDMVPNLMMENDTFLNTLLTREDYQIIEDKLRTKRFPLMMFENTKPMFLTFVIELDFMPGALKNETYFSYEKELSKLAEEKNISVSSLETVEYQINLFDSIPYKAQAEILVKTILEGDNPSHLNAIIELYKKQNIQELYKMIKKDKLTSKYEKYLFTNRNKNWIPIIEDKISKQPTVFAVGAGHLCGKKGVINLLRNKGYSLTPVK